MAPPENLNSSQLVTTKLSETGKVCIITLNRPKARNAISRQLAVDLFTALGDADRSPSVRVAIITASGRAFSAGADVKELQTLTPETAFREDWLANWNANIVSFRKPLIAAVNGYALGGGMELAMMCDIIHCAKSASFALPEISLGTIPGAGGTQRLVSAVGKSRAFEMIYSGERMLSEEALRLGLVSKVFEDHVLLESCLDFAENLASMSQTALMMAKQAVNLSQRTLLDGVRQEKNLYHMSFGNSCFREGTSAFIEKRKPNFDE